MERNTSRSRACIPPAHISRPRISDALLPIALKVPCAVWVARTGMRGLEFTCVRLICKRLLALRHVKVAVALQQSHMHPRLFSQ